MAILNIKATDTSKNNAVALAASQAQQKAIQSGAASLSALGNQVTDRAFNQDASAIIGNQEGTNIDVLAGLNNLAAAYGRSVDPLVARQNTMVEQAQNLSRPQIEAGVLADAQITKYKQGLTDINAANTKHLMDVEKSKSGGFGYSEQLYNIGSTEHDPVALQAAVESSQGKFSTDANKLVNTFESIAKRKPTAAEYADMQIGNYNDRSWDLFGLLDKGVLKDAKGGDATAIAKAYATRAKAISDTHGNLQFIQENQQKKLDSQFAEADSSRAMFTTEQRDLNRRRLGGNQQEYAVFNNSEFQSNLTGAQSRLDAAISAHQEAVDNNNGATTLGAHTANNAREAEAAAELAQAEQSRNALLATAEANREYGTFTEEEPNSTRSNFAENSLVSALESDQAGILSSREADINASPAGVNADREDRLSAAIERGAGSDNFNYEKFDLSREDVNPSIASRDTGYRGGIVPAGTSKRYGMPVRDYDNLSETQQNELKAQTASDNEVAKESNAKIEANKKELATATRRVDGVVKDALARDKKLAGADRTNPEVLKAYEYSKAGIPFDGGGVGSTFYKPFVEAMGKGFMDSLNKTGVGQRVKNYLKDGSGTPEDISKIQEILRAQVEKRDPVFANSEPELALKAPRSAAPNPTVSGRFANTVGGQALKEAAIKQTKIREAEKQAQGTEQSVTATSPNTPPSAADIDYYTRVQVSKGGDSVSKSGETREVSPVNAYLSEAYKTSSRDTPLSRGERTNNLGNIRRTKDNFEGSTGAQDGFVTFDRAEDGIRAVAKILRTYKSKGVNTIEGIISRYAPEADKNDTATYIANVAKIVGKKAGEQLDTKDMVKVMKGIFTQETVGGRELKPEDILKGWNASDELKLS
jgi:hypothetical protein|tara:strand:+ start:640 stop:3264 length:2625 start_codon:yes stop_codon:yes gene_type:complete